MKTCIKCNEEKSLTDFNKSERKCKKCVRSERDPVKQREYRKRWVEKNKERQLKLVRDWQLANRDSSHSYNRKRRARLAGVVSKIYTTDQVIEKYGSDCHLCGLPIDLKAPRAVRIKGWEMGLHIDHLQELFLGGSDTLDNVRPAHGKCNLSRPRPTKRKQAGPKG